MPDPGWWVTTSIVLAFLGEVLAAIFVLRVLSRGGSPSTTLAWMILILAAPYLGLLFYYLLPRRLQLRRLARRADCMAWIDPQFDNIDVLGRASRAADDAFARLLCRMDRDSVSDGNQVALLETGSDFLKHLEDSLASARKFAHLEMYIFRPDSAGKTVLRLLTETARRGVEVRLLYDSIGSWSLKRSHLAEFLAAGGEAHAYAPLLWRRRPFTLNLRNHRKLLVVDGTTAILGGRNIGDEYASDHLAQGSRWLDTMVAIEGPAVSRLQRVFVEDWYHASEQDLAAERYFPSVDPAGGDRVGVVASGPDSPFNAFGWTLQHLIGSAEESLDISSPYVIPDEPALTALRVAAMRGVRVRILTNGRQVAQTILHRAQRRHYAPLISAGVEVRESGANYNHAKFVLADTRRLLIGSPNLDVRSEQLNFELAVLAQDAPVCAAAASMFERRFAPCQPVTEQDINPQPWDPLVNGFCHLLSPVL